MAWFLKCDVLQQDNGQFGDKISQQHREFFEREWRQGREQVGHRDQRNV